MLPNFPVLTAVGPERPRPVSGDDLGAREEREELSDDFVDFDQRIDLPMPGFPL